jgi:hypothetical protein
MIFYTVISIIICLILTYITIDIVYKLSRRKRDERLAYLRSYKSGKFLRVFAAAIPLYTVAHYYTGDNIADAIFNGIAKTTMIVALRFDFGPLRELMNNSVAFTVAVYYTFTLIVVSAVLLSISLFYIWAFEKIKNRAWDKEKGDKLLVVGDNKECESIYKSEKVMPALLLTRPMKSDSKERLFAKGIAYRQTKDFSASVTALIDGAVQREGGKLVIIVNTGEDEENIKCAYAVYTRLKDILDSSEDKEATVRLLYSGLSVYVYGNPKFETVYTEIEDKSFGSIVYVNKYRQIAMNFIDKYPLTRFMGEKQIDYSTSLIRDGVDVNVALIGFGKTNMQIFLSSVANNLFLKSSAGKPEIKKVKYYVYDKVNAKNNKNLNHNYSRYENEFSRDKNPEDYLPLPETPAEVESHVLDINNPEFYNHLRYIATRGKHDATFFVIAFGTDLENIDLAHKLIEKKDEWGVECLNLFVKVRSGLDRFDIFERGDCHVIGDEKKIAYNTKAIFKPAAEEMARMRNRAYSLEYAIASGRELTDGAADKIFREADFSWSTKKTQIERESNTYGTLSLRSKLNLIGLDCVRATENGEALTESEYLKIYAGQESLPTVTDALADGKKIIDYPLDFPPFGESLRTTMAIHEHYRWNSYMISKGTIPASRREILSDVRHNGKSYRLRRHGNLTTFEGLIEFRKMIAERDGVSEHTADVIRYDYQLLDDAYWLLTKSGYKIIKRS